MCIPNGWLLVPVESRGWLLTLFHGLWCLPRTTWHRFCPGWQASKFALMAWTASSRTRDDQMKFGRRMSLFTARLCSTSLRDFVLLQQALCWYFGSLMDFLNTIVLPSTNTGCGMGEQFPCDCNSKQFFSLAGAGAANVQQVVEAGRP